MHKQLIFVLGMHRSGTSTLTRALSCLGVDIGNQTRGRADNPRGFFEDEEFVFLNNKLLATQGLGWDSTSPIDKVALNAQVNSELGREAMSFLAARYHDQPLGLKDPRAARLFPFWRKCAEVMHFDIYCLLSLRHPLSCADSLFKRDAMPKEKGVFLWFVSMQDCVQTTIGLPRLVVGYDNLLEHSSRELERIGYFLSREVLPEQVTLFTQRFLDQKLRHHKYDIESTNNKLLTLALRFYTALSSCSTSLDPNCLSNTRLMRIVTCQIV